MRVWIDLENSPHVCFFEPVIGELQRRGHEVVVTGRRFCNTLPLARARGLPVHAIGRGHDTGRNTSIKRCLFYVRSLQLWRFARDRRFDIAANHVSRAQVTAAVRLGIPIWAAYDYEHAFLWDMRAVDCFMTPGIMPAGAFDRAGIPRHVVRNYDGLKEDVYLHGFRPPANNVRRMLGIGDDEIMVVLRPCSDNAHYGTDAGRIVERHVLRRLMGQQSLRVVVLPRTAQQRRRWQALADGAGRLQVRDGPLDGPSLIHAADLVVTGGGTMAREAAVLGVPALSCFTGPLGAVDEFLAGEARLRLVRTVDEAEQIGTVGRHRTPIARSNGAPLCQVVDAICETA